MNEAITLANNPTTALAPDTKPAGMAPTAMAFRRPDGWAFSALQLRADDTLDTLYFQRGPFVAACRASGLDPDAVVADYDLLEGALECWYAAARRHGGERDDVMEDLLSEKYEATAAAHA